MKMKVLHINTGQEGGAAWCARRINRALVQKGVESRMLFANGESMPEGVEGDIARKDLAGRLRKYWLFSKFTHAMMRLPWYMNTEKRQWIMNKANTEHLYLHLPYSYYKNIAHHPLVEWADIIHLHWVPDFVDYPTFFKRVKKPIVWTLHDMFPTLGVMHFESAYSVRPKELDEIDAFCKRIKKEGLSYANNLNIVAISEMMKDIISSSDLLKEYPVTLIHNGVDTAIFKPIKSEHSLVSDFISSLKEGTKVFLFSSYGIWDKRKGLDRILKAMDNISTDRCENKALIVIGYYNENEKHPTASFPIFCTGLIKDQNELAKVYTSADLFINASYEEAFAQTPLEAMACGTPVISSPCSGASDLIRPFNGVICGGYDVEALREGIELAMAREYNREEIRRYIIENYDYSIIAEEYIKLYTSVM